MAVLRPFGEFVISPYDVSYTESDLDELVRTIQCLEGETRIVLEHTGHYYEQILLKLAGAGLFVTAVNPKLIKDFKINSLRNVKTDIGI